MLHKFHSNPWYAVAFFIIVSWLASDMSWLGMEGIFFAVVGTGVTVVVTPLALRALQNEWRKMISGHPNRLDFIAAPSGYRRARYAESEEEAIVQSIVTPTPNRPLIPDKRQVTIEETLCDDEDEDNIVEAKQPPQIKQRLVPSGGYKTLNHPKRFEELSLDPRFPVPQDMAQIIERGFKPNRNSILLMETTDGHATEKISKLHHVGLAGSSGRGKTNTTRLIVSQLLACDAKVYMVNPNFAPVKHNGNRLEDWRPIAAKLQMPVARNAPEIAALLNYFMKIFKERREREQITPKRGADIFLVLGEWPVIVEEYPDAANIIGRLLRQSRQYGIHIIAEFQDALIATIKGNSGTRENYGTAYFFGGDLTTAKALLKLKDGTKIDNNGLGDKGAVYLKSFSTEAITGRVPFFSNKALYMLLGFPEDPVTDELVDEDEFYEEQEGDFEDDDETEQTMKLMNEFLGQDEESLMSLIENMPDQNQDINSSQAKTVRQPETPKTLVPIIPDKGRKAEDIDLNAAIAVYNTGKRSRYELAKIFGLGENQGRRLKEIIEARVGGSVGD